MGPNGERRARDPASLKHYLALVHLFVYLLEICKDLQRRALEKQPLRRSRGNVRNHRRPDRVLAAAEDRTIKSRVALLEARRTLNVLPAEALVQEVGLLVRAHLRHRVPFFRACTTLTQVEGFHLGWHDVHRVADSFRNFDSALVMIINGMIRKVVALLLEQVQPIIGVL